MKNGDVIQMLIKKQGQLSLRQFAPVVGVSASYLSELYRGTREPGKKIMLFLGLKKTRTTEVSYAKNR